VDIRVLNYLYADVVALFAIAGSGNSFEPLPPWALMASAVLMEMPHRYDSGAGALAFGKARLTDRRRCWLFCRKEYK